MNFANKEKEEDYYDYVCKVVLVGESGVGKTNILSRFCKDEFLANSTSTLGVEFATKIINIEDKKVRVQIWDTAGQEKYKAITNSYYINAKGALVIYDITKFSSFESIEKWIDELRDVAGKDIIILLVGNKTDLKHLRAVAKEEGEEKAKKLGNLQYIETSAMNNTHIQDAFQNLTQSI
jgi:small GTP-binding protein